MNLEGSRPFWARSERGEAKGFLGGKGINQELSLLREFERSSGTVREHPIYSGEGGGTGDFRVLSIFWGGRGQIGRVEGGGGTKIFFFCVVVVYKDIKYL